MAPRSDWSNRCTLMKSQDQKEAAPAGTIEQHQKEMQLGMFHDMDTHPVCRELRQLVALPIMGNPSDRITFNTDRKQENLTNLDNSISSISAEFDPLKLNNKSVIHYTARNNKNAAFASLTTPSLEVTKKSNLILETDLASSQNMRLQNF